MSKVDAILLFTATIDKTVNEFMDRMNFLLTLNSHQELPSNFMLEVKSHYENHFEQNVR